MPCNYCKTHNVEKPCHKLHGPKTEVTKGLPRLIPTPDDIAISGEDALLLQYFSESMDRVFQYFSVIYGTTISDLALRHVMLAWAAKSIPNQTCQRQFENHKRESRRELACKLNKARPQISFSDVFVSWTLGHMCVDGDHDEGYAHLDGCLQLLRTFWENSKERSFDKILIWLLYVMIVFTFPALAILRHPAHLRIRQRILTLRKGAYAKLGMKFGQINSGQVYVSALFFEAEVKAAVYGSCITMFKFVVDAAEREFSRLGKDPSAGEEWHAIILELEDPLFLCALEKSKLEMSNKYLLPTQYF